MFGAFYTSGETVLSCTEFLLQDGNLDFLTSAAWWSESGFLLLLLIMFSCVQFFLAVRDDIRIRREGLWSDADFLTEDPEFYYVRKKCCRCTLASFWHELVRILFAAELGLSVRDFKLNMEKRRKEEAIARKSTKSRALGHDEKTVTVTHHVQRQMKDSPGITRTLAVCKDVEISWDDCYGAMRRASKRSRFWQFKQFFKRIQPVAKMTTHSIAMPRYLRVLVFSCRLYGALWLTCVCYLASGDVDSESSPERCKSNKDNIVAVIAFGIVSFTGSHWFSWVVLLHRRHYVYQEHWTPKMKKKKLYKWWAIDAFVTVVAIAFVMFCIFVLGVFLGKVSSGDNRAYFLSAVIGLVKDGAVSPAIISILMM
jgi:hypothetical protein